MTEKTNEERVREQLNTLVEQSYDRGLRDAQEAIAGIFDKLDANNDEANNLYKEIAKVIRTFQIVDVEGPADK